MGTPRVEMRAPMNLRDPRKVVAEVRDPETVRILNEAVQLRERFGTAPRSGSREQNGLAFLNYLRETGKEDSAMRNVVSLPSPKTRVSGSVEQGMDKLVPLTGTTDIQATGQTGLIVRPEGEQPPTFPRGDIREI